MYPSATAPEVRLAVETEMSVSEALAHGNLLPEFLTYTRPQPAFERELYGRELRGAGPWVRWDARAVGRASCRNFPPDLRSRLQRMDEVKLQDVDRPRQPPPRKHPWDSAAVEAELEQWDMGIDPAHLLRTLRETLEPPGHLPRPGRRHLQLLDPKRKHLGAVMLTFGWVP